VPLEDTIKPSEITLSPITTMPANSTLLLEVTNNALDETPTWETYTPDNNGKHAFANETKIAENWAVSMRLTLNRSGTGKATIEGLTGGYE
jgi:hypothetical protein